MERKRKFRIGTVSVLLVLAMVLSSLLAACGPTDDPAGFLKIEMAKLPVRTVYETGENFDPTGGSIYAVNADLTRTEVSLTDAGVTLSQPDMSASGQKRINVTYNEDVTSFFITVNEPAPLAPGTIVTGIAISVLPADLEYVRGEEFTAEGGVLTAFYSDGSERQIALTSSDVLLTAVDTEVIGPQTVTVTYGGETAFFTVQILPDGEISAEGVASIAMRAQPLRVSYETGETFDATGGAIDVTYADGSTVALSLLYAGVTVTPPDMRAPGTQQVLVSFGGASTTFTINISGAVPPVSTENVARITVTKNPDRTEYFVGDAFDPTGGMLDILYRDGTTVAAPMTAGGVEIDAPDMSTHGVKTIRVTVGGRRTTFTVSVVQLAGTVTFELGYSGAVNETVRVAENRTLTEPAEKPVREGYTFRGWYEDATCTVPYEFGRNIVTGDFSVYASWTEDAAASYAVTYHLNYYGVRRQQFTQYVQAGGAARDLYGDYATPTRSEFTFDGWFTDAAATHAYDGAPIMEDTVLYAGWTKNKSVETYTFEAENVDLTGMSGPGYSGSATGPEMIVSEATKAPSGGKFVSYLYKEGLALHFRFASSEEIADATVTFYLAAEFPSITLTQENYIIRINGETPSYFVTLTQSENFKAAVTFSGVALREGANLIEMITNNDVNPAGSGTYAGTAPIVDCIKITTDAVLMWDENYGLPANM